MPLRRLADRFAQAATRCRSLRSLRRLLLAASRDLEFDHVALLHHASLASPAGRMVRIDNYPPEWVAEIVAGGLAPHDPVHLASRHANAAFRWDELERLVPLGREQRMILERSRSFGLGDGLTVPVNVPGEPAGSCSFAVRRGKSIPRERLHCAEIVGTHAFDAARRLSGLGCRIARPRLSRREVQCLKLVAAGKSDWEIAAILGIAHETARQYVRRARRAYDVATRTQLALLGLRDDWVTFEELLQDPRWRAPPRP